jgi:hypothetical protein
MGSLVGSSHRYCNVHGDFDGAFPLQFIWIVTKGENYSSQRIIFSLPIVALPRQDYIGDFESGTVFLR